MKKRDMFIVGLISGAVLGAVAALLLAPKTGKETRRILANGVGNLWRRKTDGRETKDAMGSSDR
jgi:gas vesicle protein